MRLAGELIRSTPFHPLLDMERVRRLATAYFFLQGALILLWWTALALWPASRAPFIAPGGDEAGLFAFAAPDVVLAAASVAAGELLRRRHPASGGALWLVGGLVLYPTGYCFALSLATDGAWLGTVLMIPAALLSLVFATALAPPRRPLFRQARPAAPAWNMAKTAGQMVLFWTALLFVVPGQIALVEAKIGLWPVADGARFASAVLFAGFSALGVWSAAVMSRLGGGTPLPIDSPRTLVLSGPYARVRNPMAIAGLGQGAAVAVWMGSPLVMAYVILGGSLWQFVARPMEEEDLVGHFGPEYEDYRAGVRCWIPRLRPYRTAHPVVNEVLQSAGPGQ